MDATDEDATDEGATDEDATEEDATEEDATDEDTTEGFLHWLKGILKSDVKSFKNQTSYFSFQLFI